MLCIYTGNDSRSYMDYADASTGRMLQADPGGSYDVILASGRAPGLPLPPGDGRWIPDVLPPAKPAPPAPAAKPAAPSTAGDSPAEKES